MDISKLSDVEIERLALFGNGDEHVYTDEEALQILEEGRRELESNKGD